MTTRAATAADARDIALLHAESWRRTYRGMYLDSYLDGPVVDERVIAWRQRFDDPAPAQHVIVAERGGRTAGFICILGAADPKWGSYIDNLHVAPDLKRSGIGIQLMREGARWLVDNYPGAGVYLGVMQANDNARRFYESLGARDEGATEKPSVGGGTAMVCRYAWDSPAQLLRACRRGG